MLLAGWTFFVVVEFVGNLHVGIIGRISLKARQKTWIVEETGLKVNDVVIVLFLVFSYNNGTDNLFRNLRRISLMLRFV